MRIGVNLMFVVPGHVGASEPYAINLLKAMLESDHEFVVFGVRGLSAAHPFLARRAETIEVPWSSGLQPLRIAAENSWLAIESKRRRLDLLHHWSGAAPLLRGVPTAVTIHDIQVVHYPENFAPIKRFWLQQAVPRGARTSRLVVVPSEFVKRDLVSSLGIDSDRIAVVTIGSEGLLGEEMSGGELVRRRFGLDEPFFFFPARSYPHKNHLLLLSAFAPVANEVQLVFTGAPWTHDDRIREEIDQLGLEGRARHLGHVTRRDLGGLYRAAIALVYPSRFEGFGAPILEAMSVGCPVVSSNATALPEVVSNAGLLLDPDDAGAWTNAMRQLSESPDLRRELSEKGLRRAAEFSWDESAKVQLSAYESTLAR
jgi:glycosyltransferase involved in cell wall biosynthesis